jgi:hypothetical protein
MSLDPQELAIATAMLTSGKPDPECFAKDEHGLFFCVVLLSHWDATFPWDEVDFKKP